MDEERILDIIDRMRVAVPEELKQARRVIGEQERLIGEAQAHVRQVLEELEQRLSRLTASVQNGLRELQAANTVTSR